MWSKFKQQQEYSKGLAVFPTKQGKCLDHTLLIIRTKSEIQVKTGKQNRNCTKKNADTIMKMGE